MAIAFGPLTPAEFMRRDNRFRAVVRVDGIPCAVHVPNSGRLGELLIPGAPAYIRLCPDPRRKTAGDLILVEHAGRLVCVDARLPPRLLVDAWQAGRLPAFQAYERVRTEAVHGASRLDLRFEAGDGSACWVEAKSVTLVEEGIARFPDAPTERGRRHMVELVRLAQEGICSAVAFVVQREDAESFAPHDAADPGFGRALREARDAGVQVLAVRCRVTLEEIEVLAPVPLAF